MNKILFILFFILSVSIMFSESNTEIKIWNNSIYVNPARLLYGQILDIGYDFRLNNILSLDSVIVIDFKKYKEFELNLKFYPESLIIKDYKNASISGFFINLGTGFTHNILETNSINYELADLNIRFLVGYKAIFGNPIGISLEPSIGLFNRNNIYNPSGYNLANNYNSFGFMFKFKFGIAF